MKPVLVAYPMFAAMCLLAASPPGQVAGKDPLRQALKDDVVGNWIYDDIAMGFAQAKKAGKPLLVEFR